jgi:hypothetical protein
LASTETITSAAECGSESRREGATRPLFLGEPPADAAIAGERFARIVDT